MTRVLWRALVESHRLKLQLACIGIALSVLVDAPLLLQERLRTDERGLLVGEALSGIQ